MTFIRDEMPRIDMDRDYYLFCLNQAVTADGVELLLFGA